MTRTTRALALRTLAIVLCAANLTAACGKSEPAPPPVKPPFAGPVTIDRIMNSKDLAQVFDPWDQALAKLKGELGEPQRVKGGSHQWAAVEGEDCAYIGFDRGDGAKYNKQGEIVVGAEHPQRVGKDGALMNRAECMEIAGKAGTPEDPAAAGPPADGTPVPTAFFTANALGGRSKWVGKRVKVTGEANSAGGLRLGLGDDVACDGKADADATLIGKTVTVEGTVKLETLVTGGGDVSQRAVLADCVVVPAPGVAAAAPPAPAPAG